MLGLTWIVKFLQFPIDSGRVTSVRSLISMHSSFSGNCVCESISNGIGTENDKSVRFLRPTPVNTKVSNETKELKNIIELGVLNVVPSNINTFKVLKQGSGSSPLKFVHKLNRKFSKLLTNFTLSFKSMLSPSQSVNSSSVKV